MPSGWVLTEAANGDFCKGSQPFRLSPLRGELKLSMAQQLFASGTSSSCKLSSAIGAALSADLPGVELAVSVGAFSCTGGLLQNRFLLAVPVLLETALDEEGEGVVTGVKDFFRDCSEGWKEESSTDLVKGEDFLAANPDESIRIFSKGEDTTGFAINFLF